MTQPQKQLHETLWKIYRRPERPPLWHLGGNLPWDEPAFAARMLAEHLDESHGAASRTTPERAAIIDWVWAALALAPGANLLDVTCGPGLYAVALAQRGCHVTGIDFSPAAIPYAINLAQTAGVSGRCTFIQQDVRAMSPAAAQFDAAMLLYGQLAVFHPDEAQAILANIAQALKPGSKLVIELLNPAQVDKKNSTWWFTDTQGLWGDTPFLHLGERFWDAETETSIERFQIISLDDGSLQSITLCDQTYTPQRMTAQLKKAGFSHIDLYPAWAGLPLYDAEEWLIYVATR